MKGPIYLEGYTQQHIHAVLYQKPVMGHGFQTLLNHEAL